MDRTIYIVVAYDYDGNPIRRAECDSLFEASQVRDQWQRDYAVASVYESQEVRSVPRRYR